MMECLLCMLAEAGKCWCFAAAAKQRQVRIFLRPDDNGMSRQLVTGEHGTASRGSESGLTKFLCCEEICVGLLR